MNPYGITEVDIPGALGAFEAGQTARVNRLLRRQQVDAAERQADRDNDFRSVLARAFGGSGDGKASSGAAGAYSQPQIGQQIANGITLGVPSATPAPPAAPAAQPAGLTPALQQQLIAIDPEQASRVITAFNAMDDQQAQRTLAANSYMARGAMHLLNNVPEAEWPAEIQRIAPDLMAHGVTQEMLAGFQPTRRNLLYVAGSARDIEKLAEEARPRLREVAGEIIDERALPAGTRDSPVVYRSPYIPTPQGLAERPGGGVVTPAPTTPPQVGEVRRGYRFRGGDPANPQSWEQVSGATPTGSADLDNWNNAGRAGPQGPRTFR